MTCPATWTVASSTPAASLRTAWRFAWSAAASASPLEQPHPGGATAAGSKKKKEKKFISATHSDTLGAPTLTSFFYRAERSYTQSLLGSGWPSWLHFTASVSHRVGRAKSCDLTLRAVTGEFFLPLSIKPSDTSPPLVFAVGLSLAQLDARRRVNSSCGP